MCVGVWIEMMDLPAVRHAYLPPGSISETAVVWSEETDEHEEYGIDLDEAGQPVGVELLHRACTDG